MKVKLLSRVWLFATPWTAAYQAPPSMGLSRQKYWGGLEATFPFLSPKAFQLFIFYQFFKIQICNTFLKFLDMLNKLAAAFTSAGRCNGIWWKPSHRAWFVLELWIFLQVFFKRSRIPFLSRNRNFELYFGNTLLYYLFLYSITLQTISKFATMDKAY